MKSLKSVETEDSKKVVLSKPFAGWTYLTIGNWTDRCSYIDDVPFLLLEAIEQSCRERRPIAVELDAEGWSNIIVFDSIYTHIISDNVPGGNLTFKYHFVELDKGDVALGIVNSILENIEDWARFTDYGDMNEDQFSERVKDLKALCEVTLRHLPDQTFQMLKETNADE